MPRLILLATSPRLAPGLLSRDAWRAIEVTDARLCADLDDPTAIACAEAGFAFRIDDADSSGARARRLIEQARDQDVLWLVSADGDPGLTDAIATEVSSREHAPDVEVLVGSWDVAGGRLLDVVAAMDRLRSPGGCPWDAEQTHESLAPYLIEEAHETVEAIESGDRHHLAEELGDVLLQVAFHARVAEDAADPADRFDIDDVAAHLVAKLVRRHPHVFADGEATSPDEVEQAWEQIKAAERATSGSDSDDLLQGVPASLPLPLAAAKVASRVRRRALTVDPDHERTLEHALADLQAAEAYARAALRTLALGARPETEQESADG